MAKQQRKASGIPHERWLDFRHRKKKQKRGTFKTAPRPTGRRSKKNRNGGILRLRLAATAGGVISWAKHEYVDINPHSTPPPPLWLHNYVTWANYMSNVYMIKDYGSWNLKILIS